jgi:hypothetical protein
VRNLFGQPSCRATNGLQADWVGSNYDYVLELFHSAPEARRSTTGGDAPGSPCSATRRGGSTTRSCPLGAAPRPQAARPHSSVPQLQAARREALRLRGRCGTGVDPPRQPDAAATAHQKRECRPPARWCGQLPSTHNKAAAGRRNHVPPAWARPTPRRCWRAERSTALNGRSSPSSSAIPAGVQQQR